MKTAKSAGRMYLVILVFYIGASLLIGRFLDVESFPMWLRLSLGEILMLLPAGLYLAVTRTNPFSFIPFKLLSPVTVLLLVVFAYCMMPLIACVNAASMLFQQNAVSTMMVQLIDYPLPLTILFIAVVPALCEEFIFRGALYQTFRKEKIWGAVFLSALLFGIMHLNFNQFCYAFVMGIFFALLLEATGSILAPMIVHFTYNANSAVLSWLMGRTEGFSLSSGAGQDLGTILEESMKAAGVSGQEAAAGILLGLLLVFGTLLVMAAVGSFLGFLVYRGIASQNGRLLHVQILFSTRKRKEAEESRGKKPGSIFSWEVLTAIFLGILYIIWTW